MGTKYRLNVAGILRNSKGKVLVGERLGKDGAWQFPQGGVDDGETALEALYRELEEEVGITRDLYTVVEQRSGYRYQFVGGRLKFGGYGGQEQTYFLCDYHGKKSQISIDTDHPEFQNVDWIKPHRFDLNAVPEFKRSVYERVFEDFFGELPD
ncbi:RNA pyrophosphohydrolase [bacterium]|nr:RNA pyrophosphohydrolase [Verrucomicrobiales bacterium]MDC3255246.1 RNA pyrophosphohydrolase [bacterium]MDF1784818.1 RNA pyrophosphohydrolase [Verrucomicrobiales bacterium]NCF90615.1 NUDIX domain-containing protein [Verrucomicrobiaceae bacterium]